jgi:hypothetical protein
MESTSLEKRMGLLSRPAAFKMGTLTLSNLAKESIKAVGIRQVINLVARSKNLFHSGLTSRWQSDLITRSFSHRLYLAV